jgi:septal ring factor EnvC (AmiA/AmiB activator)
MNQKLINIIFGIALVVCICLLLLPNEEKTTQVQPIDYKMYERKFETLQNRIDSLRVQIISFETKTDSIKLQILRDETTIKNLDNNGIDSAFAELLRTTR